MKFLFEQTLEVFGKVRVGSTTVMTEHSIVVLYSTDDNLDPSDVNYQFTNDLSVGRCGAVSTQNFPKDKGPRVSSTRVYRCPQSLIKFNYFTWFHHPVIPHHPWYRSTLR